MAVRTKEKGEKTAAHIRDAVADAEVQVAELDLGSLESVEAFADSWQGPLGLLVNNAGVMAPPRYRQSTDGYELQFATNHLGHFALTGRLLPSLLEAPSAARRDGLVDRAPLRQGHRDRRQPAERLQPLDVVRQHQAGEPAVLRRAAAPRVTGRHVA